MRIDSVKFVQPSRVLSNDDIVGLVRQHSTGTYKGDLEKALEMIRRLLERSGAEYRCWLGEGQKPLDLITQAAEEALEEADCDKQDIDLLIFTGVDRGFLEPANSYFVAHALGMDRVECFDVVDACQSWSRAVRISHSFLQNGSYNRILIVNGEFAMNGGGLVYPALFTLERLDQIAWCFPGYTLGEGATATVVSKDPKRHWHFQYSSRPDFAELCTIPLKGYERFCLPSNSIGLNGVGHFTSFGDEMLSTGIDEVVEVFQKLNPPRKELRAVFPHTVSKKATDNAADRLGIKHLMYTIYPRCGNLASASVPAGMALAVNEGIISRGDLIAGWVGSAGMSYSAYSFVY